MAPALETVLKIIAPVFVLVGCLHLVMGAGADVLLGANIPRSVLHDPVLDSQNRFYAVAFTICGVLLWMCAQDIARYASVLRAVLIVFFLAGAARGVSIAVTGIPLPAGIGLMFTDLVGPVVLLVWLRRCETPGLD